MSYGKATSYLPVIDLKAYSRCKIARPTASGEKVTGKLLTLIAP